MNNDYIMYQKFTDLQSAEEFAQELAKAGIAYRLQDNNHSYTNLYGSFPVDFLVGVNIKQKDFIKADIVLEEYYKSEIENIDPSYYLFEYTDEELQDVVLNAPDFGRLDYTLAKHLLEKRGAALDKRVVEEKRQEQLNILTTLKPVPKMQLAIAYLLCFLMPVASIIIGFLIVNNSNILPDGTRFHIRPENDRLQGKIIIALSFITSTYIIIGAIRSW